MTGILNDLLNIGNLVKAIATLGLKHTTNLQLSLDRDIDSHQSKNIPCIESESISRQQSRGFIDIKFYLI
ncbi:hypothetical protein I8748_15645 [Nostoc sp. CENA67]|uniref:Uncharacterized protein n=1 Tax=Amazonocrinis nigriterrae CENA67 TaxID=2794033 RepID=A0A8J7HPP1_9NOST|nr:hypothetical protein [Amazonocrinis nigriterrae]MBH8563606.1 hypothetical protein [Amazonocrinis nigriterrae CENA67]